jgi:hypothetical protein
MVNIARPMGLSGIDLILNADKAHAEMVELFQRGQQVACAAREAIKFPDEHAFNLVFSRRCHQGVELRASLPPA